MAVGDLSRFCHAWLVSVDGSVLEDAPDAELVHGWVFRTRTDSPAPAPRAVGFGFNPAPAAGMPPRSRPCSRRGTGWAAPRIA